MEKAAGWSAEERRDEKEGALEESSMHRWRKRMIQRRDTESAGVDDKHGDRDSVFIESVVEAVVKHRQNARERCWECEVRRVTHVDDCDTLDVVHPPDWKTMSSDSGWCEVWWKTI